MFEKSDGRSVDENSNESKVNSETLLEEDLEVLEMEKEKWTIDNRIFSDTLSESKKAIQELEQSSSQSIVQYSSFCLRRCQSDLAILQADKKTTKSAELSYNMSQLESQLSELICIFEKNQNVVNQYQKEYEFFYTQKPQDGDD